MSKWIARECALSNTAACAFQEVGHTDFSQLVPGASAGALHGDMAFTVSLCGRFLIAVHGSTVYVYELNHVCQHERSRWKLPLSPREGLTVGSLRPITILKCPQRVISCSMDTSAGRNAIAFLMEGRSGVVFDILHERLGSLTGSNNTSFTDSGSGSGSSPATAASSSPSTSTCVCRKRPISQAIPVEDGPRSVYWSICHPDDPPRSVALCPQRNCVAFGCSSGIELH